MNLDLDNGEPLQAPTGLSAKGLTGCINRIAFAGDSGSGDIVFEIWRRHGDTVDWYLHSTVREQSFEDSEVKPGQYYEYRVRAVHGDAVSEFSDSAVVYGTA